MTDFPTADGARRREPMFFVPVVVLVLVGLLVAIQAVVSQLGVDSQDALVRDLAFVPGRLTMAIWPNHAIDLLSRVNADPFALQQAQALRYFQLPAGAVWTLLTYALLHGSWAHVGVNSIWIVAFGPPVARRFGAARFLAFFAMTAIAGALAHWAASPADVTPMIGASAADSGLMAAAARFIFQPGAPLSGRPSASRLVIEEKDQSRAPGLLALLSQRRALLFILVWMVTNFVFGAGAQALGASEAPVAWVAHVGGFLAGLVAFPLFDRPWGRASR